MNIDLKVARVENQTNNAKAIYFEYPTKSIDFKAGQFLTFILNIGQDEVRRSYSICTHPSVDKYLGIAVKRVNGGLVSNYLNDNLKVGDYVTTTSPLGNFTYQSGEQNTKELLLLAGGSGITPMLSILKEALTSTEEVTVKLLYVNNTPDDIIFKKEIDELLITYSNRLKVHHYLNSNNTDSDKEKSKGFTFFKKKAKTDSEGFITKEEIERIIKSYQPTQETVAYLCGPLGLMSLFEGALHNMSFSKHQINKELFVSSESNQKTTVNIGVISKVKVIINGDKHQFSTLPGKSILESGLAAGLEMPYSCQEGNCTACYGLCTDGDVEMLTTESLTDEELSEGGVLTCVGYATTKKTTIKF